MDIHLTPYLMLNGNAKEAADFYADLFGAPIRSMELVKDWPQEFEGDIPEGAENLVMHAHLDIGTTGLMLADIFPGQPYVPGSTITIMLDTKTVNDAEALYRKLSSGGEVLMSLSETGFSPAYAQVKDQFGVQWQIVSDFPEEN
ncbi:MAG: VOC family protein [Alkalibacterium sp.]|nr:VOC family protein [Alkalibacterium sp.]